MTDVSLTDEDLDRIEEDVNLALPLGAADFVPEKIAALLAEYRRLRAVVDQLPPPGSTWVDEDGRSWMVGHPATFLFDPKTGETQWRAMGTSSP